MTARWDVNLVIQAPIGRVFEIERRWHTFPELRKRAEIVRYTVEKENRNSEYFWIAVKDLPLIHSYCYGKRLLRSPDLIITMFVYRWLRSIKLCKPEEIDRLIAEDWDAFFYRTVRLVPLSERQTRLLVNEPGSSWQSEEELQQVRAYYREIKRLAEGELMRLGIDAVAEEVDADDSGGWADTGETAADPAAETIDVDVEAETFRDGGEAYDPYHVLGLEPGAPLEAVKQAYRGEVRAWHPDLVRSASARADYAHNRFIEVTAAYHTILRETEV